MSDNFVAAVGLPLLRGRSLGPGVRDATAPVVVVNAALAAAHFPGQDAIGKRITMRGRSWEIVGLVGNKRHTTLVQAPLPEM